jgi:hypothetical protein
MQIGIHLVHRPALDELRARGVNVPEPWIGVLDLMRLIEGLGPEPESDRPLGVVGVDALLTASGPDSEAVMRLVRRGLHEARRYFEWRRIALCLLVQSRLHAAADGSPELDTPEGVRSLTPLVGQGMRPMANTMTSSAREADWWWAPQLG